MSTAKARIHEDVKNHVRKMFVCFMMMMAMAKAVSDEGREKDLFLTTEPSTPFAIESRRTQANGIFMLLPLINILMNLVLGPLNRDRKKFRMES